VDQRGGTDPANTLRIVSLLAVPTRSSRSAIAALISANHLFALDVSYRLKKHISTCYYMNRHVNQALTPIWEV
jgi:hypothetical protein